jgi:Bacterial antitoxin of type II TA system, VapB
MVTPLQIDETLLQEALALSNHPTATALIEAALREYIQRRKQLKVLELSVLLTMRKSITTSNSDQQDECC